MMKKAVLLSLVLAAASSFAAAQMPAAGKHAQRNVSCTACHKTSAFKPVPREVCVTCHKADALAAGTDRLNFKSRLKNPKTGEIKEHVARVNPHDSYHFGETQDCADCHREHRPSVNDCAACHDVKAWGIKEPR